MLSEEEKKAIERLEEQLNFWKKQNIKNSDCEIILNLITKLQKENEDLLREKEENKFIIAMANNEMLGYNQGYSDAENKNSNATEIVIKNRQAYIHKEEVECYKRKIDFLQKQINEEHQKINGELREKVKELEEERQLVGIPVRNKRNGTIGIVLHQWKSGSIAVLENINPRVINTHDSWSTLEIITDEIKQTKTKDDSMAKQIQESEDK